MDDRNESEKPERLKDLACNTIFPGGNRLLHEFVLNCSAPNEPASENFISAVLRCMADAPGRTVNALNDDGCTPLHLAIIKRNVLMVRKLLSCLVNIDVDEKCEYCNTCEEGDFQSLTALHMATKLNYLSIMQELCDKGADIHIENEQNFCRIGNTALHIAAGRGHVDAMKLLITKGADENADAGLTPLDMAAYHGKFAAVKYLVMRGADVNESLGWAVQRDNDVAIVEFLISKGAAVNIIHKDSEVPLHLAVRYSSTEVVECLLRSGADVHARNWRDNTPLHLALEERNELIEFFLSYSCAHQQDRAMRQEMLRIARLLIDEGADLRAIDEEGKTPHHDAVYEKASRMRKYCAWDHATASRYRKRGKVIRLLLDKGADLSARNENGQTPLDLARNQKSIDALLDIVLEGSATDDVLPAKRMKT